MKYAVDSVMAKKIDDYSINIAGMPSLVLMERAALAVARQVAELVVNSGRECKIAAICGCGNNGADGIAAARILSWQGIPVDIVIVGREENSTEEFIRQKEIAKNSGLSFVVFDENKEYDIIVDAVFGIGLSRPVEGKYSAVIEWINKRSGKCVSVDVPSGIHAGNGAVLGCAVNADITVTFGYNKAGLMLFPGKSLAGSVVVADVGFSPEAIRELNPYMYFTEEDIKKIPLRSEQSNKGTYGRVLVIAGSKNMSGAAVFSARAAYRSGAGLVEVFTHEAVGTVVSSMIPEAIVTTYNEENMPDLLEKSILRASVVVLGPGISKEDIAVSLVKNTLNLVKVPMIIDADGLNIIAGNVWLLKMLKNLTSTVIITPHILEMERLCGLNREIIKSGAIDVAREFAVANNVICVLKDAVTVAAEPDEGKTAGNYSKRIYINTSGCSAMAKGGSGDALTGIIAGMLALKLEPFSATAMGVYIHGLAGEAAAERMSSHSVLVTDLIEMIGKVI